MTEVPGTQSHLVSLLGVERKRARIMARQVAVSSSLRQHYNTVCSIQYTVCWYYNTCRVYELLCTSHGGWVATGVHQGDAGPRPQEQLHRLDHPLAGRKVQGGPTLAVLDRGAGM